VKDGALFFAKGYGYADVAKRKPIDPERSLFRIGSTSKLFTWTSVMQLVEQGKIDLDADVNKYIDFKIPATYPQPRQRQWLPASQGGAAGANDPLGARVAHQRFEPLGLGLEHRPAERRQPVVAAAVVVFVRRGAAIGLADQRQRLEPGQGGVERAGAEPQRTLGPLGDVADDAVAVAMRAGQREQDVELLWR